MREDGSVAGGSVRAEVEEAKVDALLALSDPMRESIAAIAEECGLNSGQIAALSKRLATSFVPLKRALDSVTNAEMAKLYRAKSYEVLASISESDIAEAGLKEKAIAAAVLTDKSLLLDGQPTQVLSIKELGNLDQLGAMLMAEMRKRGIEPAPNEATQEVSSTDHGLLGTSQDPSNQVLIPASGRAAAVGRSYDWEAEPR